MRNIALDHLRAFVTVLVVAHHAVLAYNPYAPPLGTFDAGNMMWGAFPIIDAHRAAGIDVFVGFNDTFFMSLMFLLSGLFVWPGIERKGARGFLHDRLVRLGIPFLVSISILAPLAYFPAWLQRGGEGGIAGFAQAWLSLDVWPAGPAWFLWVLLAFDVLAAAAFRVAPNWAEAAGRKIASRSAAAFFGWLVVIAILAFVPLASVVDPSKWASYGPFFMQTARILLYASFFAVGIAVGAFGIARGVLASGGAFARRWLLWSNLAPIMYFALVAVFITLLVTNGKQQPIAGLETTVLIAFAISCATSSIAFLSIFLRFGQKQRPAFDSLARNAYGIYLVHYACVNWLQYALLDLDWPGIAKCCTVFIGALAASWTITATLRRIPTVARLI